MRHRSAPPAIARLPVRLPCRLLLALALLAPLAGMPGGTVRAQSAAGARTYVVDAAASDITVRLYRSGLFSALGHDHVIVARDFSGSVVFDPADPATAKAELTLPVTAMEVDLPEARKAAGLEGTLSEDDRDSVRETMLGPEQLDAARYSEIRAVTERVEGALPELTLTVRLRIKGSEKAVPLPLTVALEGGTLTADGAVELLQSEFGITPFSTALGTVAVRDRLRVTLRLVAHTAP